LVARNHPVADQFAAPKGSEPVQIGKRTGFAFIFDGRSVRSASSNAVALNTTRRPFDQLPENFIEGEALREAIAAVDPRAKRDRPARQFSDGPAAPDPSLSALSPAWRSAVFARVASRAVAGPTAPPASSSPTTRQQNPRRWRSRGVERHRQG
jgi:hypothetical protein